MSLKLEINEEECRLLLLAVNHTAQSMSSQFMIASANDRREPILAALRALSKRLDVLVEPSERDGAAQFLDIGVPVDAPHRQFSLVADGEMPDAGESGSWVLPGSA